jgi:hypothetical protein
VLEDRSAGYARRHRLDLDFVTTGEFRTPRVGLSGRARSADGAVTIRTAATSAAAEAADDETLEDTEQPTRPASAAPIAAKPKDAGSRVESSTNSSSYFVAPAAAASP